LLAAAGLLVGFQVARSWLLLGALLASVVALWLVYRIPARHFLTAFLVYLPFSLRIPVRGDTTLPSAFLLLYLCFIRFFMFEFGRRGRKLTWSWTHLWVVLFLALGTLSTATSTGRGESVRKMFYVVHFALTYCAVFLVYRPEDLTAALPAMAIGMSLLALVGVVQFAASLVVGREAVATTMKQAMVWTVGSKTAEAFSSKANPYNWYTKFGSMRAVGLGVTAMQFAQNLLPVTLPSAAIAFSHLNTPRRGVFLPAFILCLGGIIASFSRGAWVSLAVGLALVLALVVALRSLRGTILALRFVAIVLACVLVAIAALPAELRANLQDMLLSIANIEGDTAANYVGSNEVRFLTYRLALEVLKEHPWVGVGPGNYADAANNVANVTAMGIAVGAGRDTPHNQFLLIACEMGIPAVLAFLLLAFTACARFLRAARTGRDPTLRLASVGWLAGIVGMGLFYLVETNAYIPDVNCLLWAIAGFSVVVGSAPSITPAPGPVAHAPGGQPCA
jgi:O-antigen ligase